MLRLELPSKDKLDFVYDQLMMLTANSTVQMYRYAKRKLQCIEYYVRFDEEHWEYVLTSGTLSNAWGEGAGTIDTLRIKLLKQYLDGFYENIIVKN